MDGQGRPDPYRGHREQIPLSNINPGYQDEIVTDYPRASYSEHGPAIPLERRGSDASSFNSETGIGVHRRSQWAKEEGPRDTAVLLESLPSKQLEKMASEIAHGQTVRKKSSRRKSFHPNLHFPQGRDVSEDFIRAVHDNPDAAELEDDDIKAMTMNLSQKRRLKSEVSLKRKQPKTLTRWKRFKYNCSITWKHFKYNLAEFGYFLKLWRGHMKKIEGHFGTGVLSYFLFLKWLFYINIPVFVLTFGFVILPQILYRHMVQEGKAYPQNVSFTGKELLTGAGWFEETELYYGYYTYETFSITKDSYYNMKYAYLFTCGGYYLLCLIILALSISKSYKKNYIEGSGAFDFYYVSRVFCGWDYGITAKNSATLKHKGIFNELKEYLSGSRKEEKEKTFGEKCKWFSIRVVTNLLILGMIGGSGYLIFYISDTQSVNVDIPVLSEMAMPLCVSGVNLVLPFIFSVIARVESYEKPKNELYINMTRTMLLKAVTLGVLVYFWYQRLEHNCRETFIGQQIYRLVIVDFIFILLTTFFVEFVRRLMKEYCCKSLSYPEFEIGRNTLNLIYSQALCWLGMYFAPMLSLIMIIKLFIIFYVKRVSVIQNCKPSLRPWRASRAHTIFMGFLFCFFIMATAAVACAIIFLKPSTDCGPFRNHTTSYEVVEQLVEGWRNKYEVLHTIIQVISSSGFIAATLVVLLVLTYYMRIVMVGHKEMVDLLRQQLSMEGRDKAYLLNMLQAANKKHKDRPKGPNRILSSGSEASGTLTSTAPDGSQATVSAEVHNDCDVML
ncbi:transmembrane channel-like protein 7 isoform X2 [Mercenaria mercenaria]|uniref:transmembrane channel-like protein 7 isoform X2 n=1 Tax=Mercenaria mercenaria TaxID=6596 RepID=UPI00234E723E|nr:transmembrane channel-like protein 7 isoform X2 [Mercenaria mercenaria]XP_053393392.1 transmembrane channel-like protein 7 isoform X2 [Mercenaria mercenaria]